MLRKTHWIAMAFSWKDKKDIWKGEGIYFVTFVVTGGQRLLKGLVRIREDGSFAPVRSDIDACQLKGFRYQGIPHDSTRWRVIAGNVMLGMVANE